MLNSRSVITPDTWTRDFIVDQTLTDLIKDDTLSLPTFDVTEGLGTSTAASRMVFFPRGGGDMEVICTMKYIAPTASGSEELGCFLRRTQGSTGGRTYYWARINDGNARLTLQSDGGSFTNLSTSAWVLPQGEVATITMRAIGSDIEATFSATTPTDVTLTATDSTSTGGLGGWRTLTSTGYLRTATVKLL